VVDPADGKALVGRLRQQLDGQLELHAILAPNYGVTIVEAFAAQANKFTAIRHVAQARQIPPERIVAVGDDVNDIPMLTGAGLGAAMPHAPGNVKAAADVVAENGLAAFVSDLLTKDCA
jgi:hydroxymethylpyrimidine pyrophosphatase-like HAD family hydrolase